MILVQCRWKVSFPPFSPVSLELQEVESAHGMPTSKVMVPFVTVQAKVTEELAAATAQVSHLQLKMTAHQKKETELQLQLTDNLKETDLLRGHVTRLQADLSGKLSEENGSMAPFKLELNGILPLLPFGLMLMALVKD
jgi:hypothetical protein